MKKILGLFLVVMVAFNCVAQITIDDKNYKIELGAQYDIGSGGTHSTYKAEPDGNGGFYSLGINEKTKNSLIIDRFDNKLNLYKTEQVALPIVLEKDGGALRSVADKKYLFYTVTDKKINQSTLFSQQVDVKNAKLIGEPKKLFTSEIPTSYNPFKYDFDFSSDKSTMLIHYNIVKKNEDPKVGLYVYDADMVQKVGKEITHKDARTVGVNLVIRNTGDVAFINEYREPAGDITVGKAKYGYIKANENKFELVTLPLKQINDCMLSEFNGELIVVCTYYQETPGINNADGLYLAKIDETGKLTKIGSGAFEIPTSVIRQYESPKEWVDFDKNPGSDVQLPSFHLREMTCDANGNLIVVGNLSGGGPMYVTSISKLGNENWWVKIPQYIAQDSYIMHSKLILLNGNCYIFYMDTPKNIGLTTEQFPNVQALYTDGILVCAKIEPKGKVTKSVVYEMDIHEMLFLGPEYGDISANQIFNHNKRGRYTRIAKITIKD